MKLEFTPLQTFCLLLMFMSVVLSLLSRNWSAAVGYFNAILWILISMEK